MYYHNIGKFKRINKTIARKLWDNGNNDKPIYFCPVNLRPGPPFNPEICFYKTGENFEKCVNAFEFYNCTCKETGYYTAFYIVPCEN